MDNEYILRWIAEFGMHKEVSPTELNDSEWGQDFAWSKAVDKGYLIHCKQGYRVDYQLTQKAIQKLEKGDG